MLELPKARVLGGVTPIQRSPLPALPNPTPRRDGQQLWASAPYRRELAVVPPAGPDKRFYRGNFSGIRVPGAPPVKDGKNATVPGGDTSFIYSPHLPRYPFDWQHTICEQYAGRGYTHFFMHLANTISDEADSSHQTLDEYIAAAKVAQSYGLWVDTSVIFGPRDATADYYQPIFDPIIDRLYQAGVLDLATVGMQLDLWNSPYGLRTIIEWFGRKVKSLDSNIPVASHWANHACAWFGADHNGDSGFKNRFEFWDYWHQTGLMDWAYFQTDTGAPIDDYEGRITELLKTCDTVGFEVTAQAQFDPDYTADKIQVDEDHGDAMGYCGLCATGGPYRNAGFNNGGRDLDGSRL